MRVIAGKFRSRPLASLEGQETRPTYDRLKETLFNVLAAAGILEEAEFLDLFAGTGSIAIEALSRGAAHVTLVENNRRAARIINENLKVLNIADEAEVMECDVAEGLRRLRQQDRSFDVIFLDPPYKMQGAYEQVLRLVSESFVLQQSALPAANNDAAPVPTSSALLRHGGILIAEHEKRFDPGNGTPQIARYRTLTQGESSLSFYKSRD
ncbi:MAG TPA: 16S rRNA (guanine(966)-N(2))-methyltransferase RsmD [candidate division Zixibacteria bacterium]|nr:16S rRNA (guanine(966)-N(2))-methyltransferase RsmD [candidate division Zixibacteria bacterium]